MPKGRCSVAGCEGVPAARQLCSKHYQRWWRRGSLELAPGYEPRTLQQRLEAKIVKGPGCWTWMGSHDPEGYGKISVRSRMTNAHRIAYQIYVGPIPEAYEVDHLCRNRGCVNPAHLEAVPKPVNIARGEGAAARYARRTHCKHGHEYTPANTRLSRTGTRQCRECERLRTRRRWAEDPEGMRRRERARVRPPRIPKGE